MSRSIPVSEVRSLLLGARVASRLSQQEVATRADIPLKTVKRIDRGRHDIGIDAFMAYGRAVHVPFRLEIRERKS